MKTTQVAEGTLLRIAVKPRAKDFKVELEENNLLVHCRNPPEKGKANKELMKELSKLFEHEVLIVSGLKSKDKVILLKDAKPHELELSLSKLLTYEIHRSKST